MATIGTMNPTLLDVQSRLDPNNAVAQIIEMMNQTNEIVQDMTMVEGNLPTVIKQLYVQACRSNMAYA